MTAVVSPATERRHRAGPALPRVLWLPLGVVAVPSVVLTVILAVLYAGQSTGSRLDRWVLPGLHSTVSGSVGYDLAWIVGTAADPLPAAVLVLALVAVCLLLGRPRLAVLAVVGQVLTGLVTSVGKHLVGRTIHGGNLSFPSGHTAQLTGMAILVGLLLVDTRRIGARAPATGLVLGCAVIGGAAMAWSTTSMDVHYLTDTVAGFCVALVLVPLSAWLIDRCFDRLC
jgi:membrane-associated phospholipid phosphatase